MKKFFSRLLLLANLFALSSCATIINTTTQEVEIKTTPSNAKITIDGKKYGTTPQKINLERKSNHVVKIDLDGYETYETQITRKISFWFWGNILNGIIPGLLTDYITGSMYNLLPVTLETELRPVKQEKPLKK
ncbi:MAG: PEGA domain-containing protein [Bacteroidota bacterium]